jgi:hypothetical protein
MKQGNIRSNSLIKVRGVSNQFAMTTRSSEDSLVVLCRKVVPALQDARTYEVSTARASKSAPTQNNNNILRMALTESSL